MKKTLYILGLSFAFMAIVAIPVQAEIIGDASSDAAQDSSVVDSSPSADSAQDGSANINSTPSADTDQDGAAGIVSDPSADTDQDGAAGIVSDPSTDVDQDDNSGNGGGNNNGGNTGGSGGSGGSTGGSSSGGRSSGGSSIVISAPVVTPIVTTSCPLITDYLKLGGDNDPVQVSNLQVFLADRGYDVVVTGVFDERTEAAVKRFQLDYLSDILGPWDATRATGFVYITTQKKINELACAQPITLSAEEISIIEAFKARVAAEQNGSTVSDGVSDGEIAVDSSTPRTRNTAAAAGASILAKFWAFIKSLFR